MKDKIAVVTTIPSSDPLINNLLKIDFLQFSLQTDTE